MYEAFSSLRPYVFGFTSRPLCPGCWSVPWLRRLVTGLSPGRHVFDSGPIHVKFGVGILVLRQASLRVIRFSPVTLTAFLTGQGSEAWTPSNNALLFRKFGALKKKCIRLRKEGLCSRMLSSGSGLCCRLPLFPGSKKKGSASALLVTQQPWTQSLRLFPCLCSRIFHSNELALIMPSLSIVYERRVVFNFVFGALHSGLHKSLAPGRPVDYISVFFP